MSKTDQISQRKLDALVNKFSGPSAANGNVMGKSQITQQKGQQHSAPL